MFQNEILSPRDSASSRVQDEANYVLIFKLLLRMLKQFKCHLVQRMQLIRTAWAVSLTTSDDGGGRDIYIYPAKNKCPYHCTILPVVTACYVFHLQQASSQIMPSFLTTQNTTKDNCSILHAQTATVSTSAYCIYFSLMYLLQPTVFLNGKYCLLVCSQTRDGQLSPGQLQRSTTNSSVTIRTYLVSTRTNTFKLRSK